MKLKPLFLIFFVLLGLNLYSQQEIVSSNKELPVGTIIISLVDFADFCTLSGDIASIHWDAHRSKWAPADGRNVEHSQYSDGTHKTNLPDLRGVFLRGLNSFDSHSPATVRHRQADPENNRSSGSFQNQSTQIMTISKTELDCFWGGVLRRDGLFLGNSKPVDSISETRPKNVAVYYYIKIN